MSKPTLVDHLGRPIERAVLTREIAGPTVSGVRSTVSAHPENGLTPGRLATLLREAEDGDPIAYLELAEAIEEKDAHYRSVLATRKLAVCQLEITVEAATDDKVDEENAELVREWLDRDTLDDELLDVLDGLGKGYSVSEIVWDLSADRWWPNRLVWRDPRWFRFDRIDRETLRLRGEGGEELPLAPFKYVVHTPKTKSGLPVRGGFARTMAWLYLFKNYAVKDWVAFAEIYGVPFRLGRYEDGTSEENINKLARALANMGSDAAAVIAKSMEVEFVDAGRGGESGGGEVFKALVDFCDLQASKLVLGQTTTTDAVSGGHAVGKEHNQVRDELRKADARSLAATLNRDLVRPLVALNRGPQLRWPKIKIGLPKAVDVQGLATALGTLVPLGLKVSAKEVRDQLGLREPEGDEEVLGAAAPRPEDSSPKGSGSRADLAPGRTSAPAGGAASESLLEPLKTTSAGELPPSDAIDRAVSSAGEDWEPLTEGLVAPLRDRIDAAESLEAVRALLIDAIDEMDADPLASMLARLGFNARLAGAADLDLADNTET